MNICINIFYIFRYIYPFVTGTDKKCPFQEIFFSNIFLFLFMAYKMGILCKIDMILCLYVSHRAL